MNKTKKGIPAFFTSTEFFVLLILAGLLVITTIQQNNFFTLPVLQNTLISWSPLILLTIGQSIVIICGGLDMSAGCAMSLMLCVMARIMKADQPGTGVTALIVCVIVMLIVGILNGLVVGVFKLPPLIATFATSYIFLGAALWIMPSPGGECVPWLRFFYRFNAVDTAPEALKNFPLPFSIFLIAAACIIWGFVYRSRTGRYIYAVGSNRNLAFESGINTAKIQITAYMLNSLFCMFAALFLVAQNQSGSARIGDPLTLKSIASAAIGGIALTGGVGNVYVGIAGAAIINLVQKIIFNAGLKTEVQTIVSGIILLAAITVAALIRIVKDNMAKKEVPSNG